MENKATTLRLDSTTTPKNDPPVIQVQPPQAPPVEKFGFNKHYLILGGLLRILIIVFFLPAWISAAAMEDGDQKTRGYSIFVLKIYFQLIS
jgi:hypothetical protein